MHVKKNPTADASFQLGLLGSQMANSQVKHEGGVKYAK